VCEVTKPKAKKPRRKATETGVASTGADIRALARQYAPAAFRELERMASEGASQATRDAAKATLHRHRHAAQKLGK
jgi:hypothetical protein